jgi:ubiquinone/menaquinone biosynthesis C-methylase UbiE
MGKLIEFVTPLHSSTKRKYIDRMIDDKVNCMLKAKEYEFDYWDGDRRFGYGGYKYIPDRWKQVAETLIENYDLNNNSSILDVGCGKGFLLYEIQKLLPKIKIVGFDISTHGINSALSGIKENLFIHKAQEKYNFNNDEFDLSISLGCFHNLKINELAITLPEFNRVAKNSYLMVESYRNEQELFNLQCWALTCESFFEKDEWIWIFEKFNYSGDYEFIYFE